jgi:hypothetical protein
MNRYDAHARDVRGKRGGVKMAVAVIPRGEGAERRVRSLI